MKEKRYIAIEGQFYPVVISDDNEVLLAAKAAGSTVIGLLSGMKDQPLSAAFYVVEESENITEELLERAVKRHLELPWSICETKRLQIREFCLGDVVQVPEDEDDSGADAVFHMEEKLKNYIEHQYKFYEFGIWAIIEKESGHLIGKVGVVQMDLDSAVNQEMMVHPETEMVLELGYHIFKPFRHNGYAKEACQGILPYVKTHISSRIYARINQSNEASVRLAESLGFTPVAQRYNERGECSCLYEDCCS